MNKIFSRSYQRQLQLCGTILIAGTLSVPTAAQGFKDSLLLDFFGNEAAVDNWKKSQKNTYSFNHLLQGPKVAKHFNNKKFGDHLFLEGGTNLFLDLSKKRETSFGDIKPWGHIAIGDWITPLHGWRVGLQMGQYDLDGKKSDLVGGGIDYLLNINAVANEKYEKRKRLEFYAVAGADLYSSECEEQRDLAFGLHMGLRAQAYLSPYTYIYIEPRLGAYSKKLVHANTWHSYVLSSSTLAGLGYALSPIDIRRKEEYATSGSFLDNTFFSLSAGPSALFNLGTGSSLSDKMGVMGMLHFGKWFDPYSALRVGLGFASRRQPQAKKVKALSASAGYMWNMHNTFGGYNPDRKFWINAVADASMHYSSSGNGRNVAFGLGAGIQPNVRVAKGIDLFLEPRVDAYTKDYASSVGANENFDLTASLLAGVAFRQGLDTKDQLLRNDNFINQTPYDHLFLDLGVNGMFPVTKDFGKNTFSHMGPAFYAGLGKWFNATSGLHLWAEMARIEEMNDKHFETIDFGLDYMWNLTNALHGYEPSRPCELIASVGINGLSKLTNGSFYMGANAGLKGLWHLNDMLSLYVEPQARLYGPNVFPGSTFLFDKTDVLGALMAGVELTMNGYRPADNLPQFEDNGRKGFFSFGLGTSTTADAYKESGNYGLAGRLSYGKWWNPVSAWRANLNGLLKPKEPYHYLALTAGADYMADLTTLAYGYNPDRIVNLRGIAGINMGMDIKSQLDKRTHFLSDIHVGGQLAFALGSKNELFIEPQLGYLIGGKPTTENKERVQGTFLLGMNHHMHALGGEQVKQNEAFTQQTPYDHLFVDLGLGGLMPVSNSKGSNVFSLIHPNFYVGVGKWFNATSGLRLWAEANRLEDVNKKTTDVMNFGVDYLWKMTNTFLGYQPDRIFEVVGVAGLNGMSQLEKDKFYVGANLGLKGLWHVNDLLSLYVEPQARLYGPNVLPGSSFIFNKTDVLATLMAGVELTMNGYKPADNLPRFAENDDHGFFSYAGGLATLTTAEKNNHTKGFAGRFSYGNWFNPVSGWRMNLNGIGNLKKANRYGKLTVGADYMTDLTTLACGYNPERIVHLRSIAGANIGADFISRVHVNAHFASDLHLGGQMAFAVGRKSELYVEPQLGYVIGGRPTSEPKERLQGSVLLGVNHKLNALNSDLVKRNDDFKSERFTDHMFIDWGVSANLPITFWDGNHLLSHTNASVYAGVGKWFNATSGLRLWGEFAKLEDIDSKRINALDFGIDYLWNLTNAFRGYDPNRTFELIGSAGLNGMSKLDNSKFYVGANLGLRGLWHLNDLTGIYVEPQARIYGQDVMPNSAFLFRKTDVIGALMAGVQFKMNSYSPSANQAAFEENERNSFFSVAGGIGTNGDALSEPRNWGAIGRLSYGHWFTPVSGWRINLSGLAKPKEPYQYAEMTMGADYMVDLTGMAYGYNPDRIVNVRALTGLNLGGDYKTNSDEKIHFIADVHFGGQLAFAVGSKNELYVEPQLAYNIGGKKTSANKERVAASVLVGLNHRLKSLNREHVTPLDRNEDDFVSVSMGTGVHTRSILARKAIRHKMTIDFDMAYGHWFNNISGLRVGMSNSSVKLSHRYYRKNVLSLHADYLFNMLNLSDNEGHLDSDWVLNGIAGFSVNWGLNKKLDTTFAPAAQLGVELGYKVAPKWEIFAEPTGVLMGKKMWDPNHHPVIIQARLMLGTKYCF